jgi:hypothetical protein
MLYAGSKRIDMESDSPRQIVISKEDAVFWMDENGNWHNEHGKFEHPRIIKYFNKSIKKDEQGYYVAQSTDQVSEKVYFKYHDTAVFVVGIKQEKEMILLLNTGQAIPFDPGQLLVKEDSLFIKTEAHLIKFTSQVLVKLSRYLKETNGQFVFSYKGRDWTIG